MMTSDGGISANRGFTLMELLISLTIVAVIVVIIFGALRTGVKAWEKGEENTENQQRRRIVLKLLKSQIASIRTRNHGKTPFFISGDDKSMEFLSCLSLAPGNRFGAVYVKYVAAPEENGGERLAFYENNAVFMDWNSEMDDPEESEFNELISGIHDISFEYLKKQNKEEGLVWQQSWNQEEDKGFPLAVRVAFKNDEDSEPVSIVSRIGWEPYN